MKRILALLLGIMILLTGISVQAAESTLEEKASRLNKLGILKGDGKSYNLTGTLTRQEAATFIVRLLGAEKEVMTNSASYPISTFTDINSKTDWAAPYIGYCIQKGIINGYADRTFRPKAKLEMQAFAKLLLVALGYQYEKDFTWQNTLKKAEDLKIVTAGEVSLAAANPFTRGDVIKLLDRVLGMKNVQTEKEMFYNLLKNEGVTEATLAEVGLLRRTGTNRVEEVKEMSPGRYSVRFSNPPKVFSAENMILVEEGGRNLKVKSIRATDLLNSFVVDTDQPAENVKYQILIKDVIDRDNTYFQEYKKEFVSLRRQGIETDLFRISRIDVLDRRTIEVEFTHPIGDIMTNQSFYQIKRDKDVVADSSALKVNLSGETKVRIQMQNYSFVENAAYALIVSGSAQSKLGVRINSGKEDILLFLGKQTEEAKFDITAIELLDKNTIRLTTNKPVSAATAEQVFSYYLTDNNASPIAIDKATVLAGSESSEQSILLKTSRTLIENKTYNLKINQLYTEGRTESIIEKDYRFTAGVTGTSSYDLSEARQIDPYTIQFNFDTAMDQRTAAEPKNYYLRRELSVKMIVPAAIYHDYENARMLMYLAEPLKENNSATYYLYAKTDIKGANGEWRKDAAKIAFEVTDMEEEKVRFEKVIYIGDNAVQIYFNEPVAKAVPNLDVDNYRIYDKETKQELYILGVRYIDGRRIVLNAQNYNPNRTYELKVKEVLEFNGINVVKDLPATEIEKGLLVQ